MTRLVFALAGYLVHDLHESMPDMLLNSVVAIDSDRIAALGDCSADYAQYPVVALLTEDTASTKGTNESGRSEHRDRRPRILRSRSVDGSGGAVRREPILLNDDRLDTKVLMFCLVR